MANNEPKTEPQFTIKLKNIDTSEKDKTKEEIVKPAKITENPMGSGLTNNYVEPKSESAYHKFRHFMYNHLQNKWVKTILLALIGAGIIIALEVTFKLMRGK